MRNNSVIIFIIIYCHNSLLCNEKSTIVVCHLVTKGTSLEDEVVLDLFRKWLNYYG